MVLLYSFEGLLKWEKTLNALAVVLSDYTLQKITNSSFLLSLIPHMFHTLQYQGIVDNEVTLNTVLEDWRILGGLPDHCTSRLIWFYFMLLLRAGGPGCD